MLRQHHLGSIVLSFLSYSVYKFSYLVPGLSWRRGCGGEKGWGCFFGEEMATGEEGDGVLHSFDVVPLI